MLPPTTSAPFDPYDAWLGIPPQEQPPNHYRLLGLSPTETSEAVIAGAADRQMAYVRTFQTGPHARESQQLLNQIAQARLTLLNPVRKASYDEIIRSAKHSEAQAGRSGGRAVAAPNDPQVGVAIGNYKLIEQIADSPLARTFRVQHAETKRYYTLKTLPREAGRRMEVRKRFEREMEILTRLDHENLIVGYEGGEYNGVQYLVMEYVLGTDLATLVRQQGPLPVDQALDYLLQAARGLQQLHLHGVVHRDVKPHVLLVDLQGRLKITNLIKAKIGESSPLQVQDDELTTMGQQMGSMDYLPPEQALDARKADARSDLYSLGCTLYFLLRGKPPYVTKSPVELMLMHRQAPIPVLRAKRADVPAYVDQVLHKLMAKDPAHRYASAKELLADLEKPPQPPRRSLWQRLRGLVSWRR